MSSAITRHIRRNHAVSAAIRSGRAGDASYAIRASRRGVESPHAPIDAYGLTTEASAPLLSNTLFVHAEPSVFGQPEYRVK